MTDIPTAVDAAQNTALEPQHVADATMAITADNVHTATFRELLGLDAYVIDGFTLIGDKDELMGVPHAITGLTYWMHKPKQRGFVALESTIGDAASLELALKRGWIPKKTKLDELPFSPNERVVYNDGSTGVRRQVTKLLHKARLIDVGNEQINDDSRFDLPWTSWASFSQYKRQTVDDEGNEIIVPHFTENERGYPLVIGAIRGLTKSEYSNSDTDEGLTYYLR